MLKRFQLNPTVQLGRLWLLGSLLWVWLAGTASESCCEERSCVPDLYQAGCLSDREFVAQFYVLTGATRKPHTQLLLVLATRRGARGCRDEEHSEAYYLISFATT